MRRNSAPCVPRALRLAPERRSFHEKRAERGEQGAVEVNLISQDTVRYGRDRKDGTSLEALVDALPGPG